MGEIISGEAVKAVMAKCSERFDTPITEKVKRAIDVTFPEDFRDYTIDYFHVCLGHAPQNQECLNLLEWALLSRNPWTPDPIKIHSLRRLRVLAYHHSLRQIYEDNFIGDQLTMEVAGKLRDFMDYCRGVGLNRQTTNQCVMTIAQQEQIPIFGVIMSMMFYANAVREKWPDETRNAIAAWLLYHKLPNQRFRQIELF